MKIIVLVILIFSLIISSNSKATLLNLSDVGGIDDLMASTAFADMGNSGKLAELNWLKSLLGDSISLDAKYDSSGGDWSAVDLQENIFYSSLKQSPSYFLLKLGDGGIDMDSHYLFENTGGLSFAVIDLAELGVNLLENKNFTIDRISHVTEFNTTTTTTIQIPEPAMISFFAIVLLTLSRRKTLFS